MDNSIQFPEPENPDIITRYYTFDSITTHSKFSHDFAFFINSPRLNGDLVEHGHEFTELVIVLEGTATHVINDDLYQLTAGDVFAIPKGKQHNYTHCDNFKHCNILFNVDSLSKYEHEFINTLGFNNLFDSNINLIQTFHFNEEQLKNVRSILTMMQSELSQKLFDYQETVTQYFITLLYFICRTLGYSLHSKELANPLFSETLQYIRDNLHKKIYLSDLANIAAMSTRHYERIFKKIYNTTVSIYIFHARMNQSKLLLKNTNYSVQMVAEQCGLYDSSSFIKKFKKLFGQTPLEYKKSIKQPEIKDL